MITYLRGAIVDLDSAKCVLKAEIPVLSTAIAYLRGAIVDFNSVMSVTRL